MPSFSHIWRIAGVSIAATGEANVWFRTVSGGNSVYEGDNRHPEVIVAHIEKRLSIVRAAAVAMLVAMPLAGALADPLGKGKAALENGLTSEALDWFTKGAKQGNIEAAVELADLCSRGHCSYAEARKWYLLAAGKGNAHALYSLGQIYREGLGVRRDVAAALPWYRKAAERGNAAAQHELGKMYAYGLGLSVDLREACKWYAMAANQGDLESQLEMGRLRERDFVYGLSFEEAMTWYQKAASQGDSHGMTNIARMYRDGLGMPRNLPTALVWYRKAADLGSEEARVAIAQLEAEPKGTVVAAADVATLPGLKTSTIPAVAVVERRIALVVANGAYSSSPLGNPAVDASLVASSLESIGFKVKIAKDVDLVGFDSALDNFRNEAKGADVALFYFAGHGFALPDGLKPRNYLMATSADLASGSERVLRRDGIPLDEILSGLVGNAKTTLVFVDACRNDPKANRGIGAGRGLARLESTGLANIFVGLSTRVGDVAADGEPGKGSPFARAFAASMSRKATRIDDAFRELKKTVMSETEGRQIPDVQEDDLEGPLVLAGTN